MLKKLKILIKKLKILIFLKIDFKMKNISQYNWQVWFISTVLLCIIACILFMTSKQSCDDTQTQIAAVLLIISGISLIPCMYIGCKPIP